jgi:hypothetical protein
MHYEQAVAQNAFWDTLIQQKQAAVQDAFFQDLFTATVENHTEKLAALDPEYAAALDQEQQKQAFLQGFNAVLQNAAV